jgi:hypothetical protein
VTTSNLFTGDPGAVTPPVDTNKNYFEELVGEGKKFKTPEELARGKAEADAFIEQLKAEQAKLREDLNTKLTLEQYIDKMAATGQNPNPPPNEPNGNQGENLQGLKPEDVERLIDQRVSAREAERIQTENLRTVKETLSQTLGPDFPTKLKSISQSIGMSEDDMNDMARLRPKALLALVQAQNPGQTQVQFPGPFTPPTSVNRPQTSVTGDRTKKFYDDLKAKDPKAYWTPKIQNQIHQDALRLGEKFFDS